jgi:TRAP transporter 4TM/12TM fusion protein
MADNVKKTWSENLDRLILIMGLAMLAYHLIVTQYLFLGHFEHQNVHLFFALILTFLSTLHAQAKKAWVWPVLLGLVLLSIAATVYIHINLEHLEEVVGFPDYWDMVVGVILVLLILEATRQAWGMPLVVVALVFIAYFFFGHLIKGPLYHRPFSFNFMISYLSVGLTGIYGTFLSLSANQIFLFVVFGSLMEVIKLTDFLEESAKLASRFLKAAPAQSAVISSAAVGMVTGAAVANVAITGSFTIPYMKRVGYKAHIAGAIEATASTGGQLMPPVMGAGAFMMAFFLGVPYAEVMLAAIIPAVLFYIAVYIGVQMISARENIQSSEMKPDYQLLLKRLPLFVGPIGVIIVLLLLRFSPMLTAFWALIVAVCLSYISRDTRPTLPALAKCLSKGAVIGGKIAVCLCLVGMVSQIMLTTGLGSKIAGMVEALAQGNLLIALFMTMVVCIILGMGVPPVAAYSLCAIVTVPVLVKMGINPFSAHFFSFYFSILGAVTPPVAMGALAAAAIAKANYFVTGWHAFKLAIAGFILPFIMVYNPILVLQPEPWSRAIGVLVATPVAIIAITSLIYCCGWIRLTGVEYIMSLISATALFMYCIFPAVGVGYLEYPLLFCGLGLYAIFLLMHWKRKKSLVMGYAGNQPSSPV